MSGTHSYRRTSKAQVAGVLVLVLAAWAGALFLPTPEARRPLTVAIGMWPGSEPFVLARDAGELPRERVNFVEINWSSAAMRAVGNRVVDVTVLSLDEAVRQMSQGYPLRIVLVTDISHGADAILLRDDLTDLRQLKRPRVGYEPRTAAAFMLERYLSENGMKLADIEEVPLNPAEVEETFAELALDAVVLPEPWIQRLGGRNFRKVYDSSHPGGEVVRVLAVHGEALQAHRAELRALIDAHLKWMPKLATLGSELEPVLKREGLDRAAFLGVMNKLIIPTREQNVDWLQGGDPWLRETIVRMTRQLQLKDSGKPERVAEIIDATLITTAP